MFPAPLRFDDHRLAGDTVTVVDRGPLNQNAAVRACLLYLVGDSDVDFHRPQAK
jgi:hypothetical protein